MSTKLISITYTSGLTEALPLAPLGITKRRRFVDLICEGRTPEIVALCFDRQIAWIDALSDDSYNDALKECIGLNFKKAMEMVMNDPIAFIKLGTLMLQIQTTCASLGLTPSSPTPEKNSPDGNASSTTPAPAVAAAATQTGAAT